MAHILLQKWRDFCEGQGQIRQGRPQGTSTTAGACPPGRSRCQGCTQPTPDAVSPSEGERSRGVQTMHRRDCALRVQKPFLIQNGGGGVERQM